ncbi:hypothetical protein GGI11_003358 [Coemansia sp. RSA 2049]|nr:hypothetical protein GGI11_003358 [Coemansia sp. RSA 2049]
MSFANKRPGGRILPVRRLQFEKLATAIGEIYKHNSSKLLFEELYRIGYNLVLSKNGPLVYDGVKGVLETHLLDCVHKGILKNMETASASPTIANNEALLSSVRMLWSEHVTAMLIIKDILMYVDKVYVKSAHLPSVYEMGMHVFRDKVLLAANGRLNTGVKQAILRQIDYERRGNEVNRSTLRSIADMFIELMDATRLRPLYETVLEPQIISESIAFYRGVASRRISEQGAPEYTRAAQSDIDAEMDRVDAYLAAQTSKPLRDVLLHELITTHDAEILAVPNNGIVSMFEQHDVSGLAVLYRLYCSLPSSFKVLQGMTRSHIASIGKKLSESFVVQSESEPRSQGNHGSAAQTVAAAAAARTAMALRWIQELISTYGVYDDFTVKAFAGSKDMRNTINAAFIDIVNANDRAPELLSLYIDDVMKSGLKGKSDQEIEHIFERCILLLRFLKDKDAFEHYYKVHLARRLLLVRSLSEDAEQTLISKLKIECGSQFTIKLEGMFKDIQTSADMEPLFNSSPAGAGLGLDMHVSVLTPTFWPAMASSASDSSTQESHLQPCQTANNALIDNATSRFADFYTNHRSGRTLTWQFNMGNADLKVRFGTRTHELNVTTYQMFILLLFAENDGAVELSSKEIQAKAGIPTPLLSRLLQSLACAKYKVLTKTPMSRNIGPEDRFRLNMGFRSPQYRIRIPMISAKNTVETDKEKAATMATISQERQYVIEAVVVRIMKTRKQMAHDQLVNETISQLSSRFMPTSKTIKVSIERLIDREYIMRCPNNPRLYSYLA